MFWAGQATVWKIGGNYAFYLPIHCEVILPVVDDVKTTVENVLEPFREESQSEDSVATPFFDWAVIGGRYAGEKLIQRLGKDRVTEFENWCRSAEVTISGLQFGKPTLAPSEQRSVVDAKWNEMFPSSDGTFAACPLFDHSNPQNEALGSDICPLSEARNVSCYRVVIVGPKYVACADTALAVRFMLAEEAWNGCNYMPVKWDGTIGGALLQYEDSVCRYRPPDQHRFRPTDEWLTVTVDYHA